MRKPRALTPLLWGIGVYLVPLFAKAALVPCGFAGNVYGDIQKYAIGATSCQACDLVSLINNIIGFLLALSIPIAMVLFAYAGVLYFTSATNPAKIGQARKIFFSVFVGLVIALGSYLMVETVLHVILDKGYWDTWNKIDCTRDARPREATVSQLLGKVRDIVTGGPQVSGGGELTVNGPTTGALVYKCPQGQYSDDGIECLDNNTSQPTGATAQPTYVSTALDRNTWSSGTAIEAINFANQFVPQITAACAGSPDPYCVQDNLAKNAIECNESSCVHSTNSAGASGPAQMLNTTACSLNSTINGCGTCRAEADRTNGNCSLVDQTLASNINLNIQLGVQEWNDCYTRAGGNVTLASACYNGGPGAIQPSSLCGSGYAYQCQLNPNRSWVTETVPYTQKFTTTRAQLK